MFDAIMIFNFIIKNVVRRGFGFKIKSATNQSYLLKAQTFSLLSKRLEKKTSVTRVCPFHVTSPRNALPPLLVLVLRYAAKIGAIVSGRMIRKWWSRLSDKEKKIVLEQIRSKKSKIAFAGTAFAGCVALFYVSHLVEDPITKRKRFMMLNQKQINQISEFEYISQMHKFKSAIVPPSHPIYRRVARVTNNLLLSNKDFKEVRDKVWTVTVIDRPDITNAFALPHGKVFVFTGMLNVCSNDDQLAVVLAHEIAHSILCHVAESMSKFFLVDFFLLIPSFIFWIIFPDVWAIFSEWVTSSLAEIFIHLPFSRSIEREADIVGLNLAAKACYDVREAPIFWGKMRIVHKDSPVEWLSTHPRHESRQTELQELVPQALYIRELSKCPPLSVKFSGKTTGVNEILSEMLTREKEKAMRLLEGRLWPRRINRRIKRPILLWCGHMQRLPATRFVKRILSECRGKAIESLEKMDLPPLAEILQNLCGAENDDLL